MGCYILHLRTNSKLLHLLNTILINIINTNTKVISKLIHIDLVVLNTIIRRKTLHIYLHNHSQKDYFHIFCTPFVSSHLSCATFCTPFTKGLFPYILHTFCLITFKLCNILHTFYKIIHKRNLQLYFIHSRSRSFRNRHSLMFPRVFPHKD
jgi:hypothetical protein